MTDEQRTALKLAFGAHLKTGAALLEVWLSTLPPARVARISEAQSFYGMPIGLLMTGPNEGLSCAVYFVHTRAGQIVQTVDRIELALEPDEAGRGN